MFVLVGPNDPLSLFHGLQNVEHSVDVSGDLHAGERFYECASVIDHERAANRPHDFFAVHVLLTVSAIGIVCFEIGVAQEFNRELVFVAKLSMALD